MPYNNSDLGVVLPSTQPALGQVMQNAIGLEERQQARQDNLDERRYESEQRNEIARQNKMQSNANANWNTIGGLQKEYKPLDVITADATNNAVKSIFDVLKKNTHLPPASFDELKYNLVSEFLPTYKKMELEKDYAKEQTSNFTKALPSADLQSVKEVVDNQFKQRFLNADGSIKKPNEVSGTYDYTSVLNDPNKLDWVVKDTSALPKFFDSVKTTQTRGGELVGKNGKRHSVNWSGYTTKYSAPVFAKDDGVPEIETSYQEVPLKDGKTMKIASDVLKQDMDSVPDVKAAFEISWKNYKNKEKLTNLSQAENDLLKEKYRLDYADSQLKRLQGVNKDKKDTEIVIKNSIGNSGSSSASSGVEIKDVFNELVANIGGRKSVALNKLPEAQQKAILSAARGVSDGIEEPALDEEGKQAIDANSGKLLTKRRQIDQRDITVGVEDGKVKVFGVNKKDGQAVRGDEIVSLGFYDVNAKSNKGVKATQAVIKAEKAATKPTTTTTKGTGKKYKGIDAQGNPIFE